MLQQFYPEPPSSGFKYILHKDMHFAAAHFIPHSAAGKCSKIHGHTYFVDVTVAGNKLDQLGFLINFQAIKKAIHDRYDHSLMNDHVEFAYDIDELKEDVPAPSTERVAEEIAKRIQKLLNEDGRGVACLQVIVRETPTSYVVYRPEVSVIEESYFADGQVYTTPRKKLYIEGELVHDDI